MKVAFVDELRFIPYPKVNIDKQPITRSQGEFLFLLKKLKEIRSRLVCEEYTLNLLHNGDEKKDEKVDPETFALEIPKSLLRDLNYIESQLAILGGKLRDDESRTLANGAHDALYNIILYLEKQVQKVRSQKSD